MSFVVDVRSHRDTSGDGGLPTGIIPVNREDLTTYAGQIADQDITFTLPIKDLDGLNHELNRIVYNLYRSDNYNAGYSTRWYLSAYDCDLDAAEADIDGADAELVVTGNCAIEEDHVIPANIRITREGNGRFTIVEGATLTILHAGQWDYHQIFYGDGRALVGKQAGFRLCQVWWTGYESNGIDDTPKMQQIVDSLSIETGGGGDSGGRVGLCEGTWRIGGLELPHNSIWEGMGNNSYGRYGVGGTVWIPPDDYDIDGRIAHIFQDAQNVTIKDLTLDIDTITDYQCFVQHGVAGAGTQYNVTLERVIMRGVGADHMPLHEVKTDSGSDWECVDNHYHHVTYVVGENSVGCLLSTVNSTFQFVQPKGICVGPLPTIIQSNGHGRLEIIQRDFRGPAGADYDDITETLHRTQVNVQITYGSGTFTSSDVSTSASTIKITAYTPRVGDSVQFTTTGTLPSGLSLATTYYVESYNATTKKLKLMSTDGYPWTIVSLTTGGSGTHTITTTGTKYVTLTEGTSPCFTSSDFLQKCVVTGKVNSYFSKIDHSFGAYIHDRSTASGVNQSMTVYRQTPSQQLGYAGIVINGDRGTTIIRDGAEEGFINGLIATSGTTEYYNSILLDNAGIESRIRCEGTVILDMRGNSIFSGAIEQVGGISPIIYNDSLDVVCAGLTRGSGSIYGTRLAFEANPYGNYSNSFRKPVEQAILDRGNFTVRLTQRHEGNLTVFDQTGDNDADNEFACLMGVTTQSTEGAIHKHLLYLGVVDKENLDHKRFGYAFYRSGDTGWLNVQGDQSDAAFKGVKFWDQITALAYNHVTLSGATNYATINIADTKTLDITDDATLSGTNTGDQSVFKTIAVSGQSDVVADSPTDTLTLVAGSGVTITTNAGTDTITITASGGSLSDGDKGDITVSSSGATWTIDNGVVSLVKMANLAPYTFIGNNTASSATPLALTVTQSRTLLGLNATTTNGLAIYDGSNYVTDADLTFNGSTLVVATASGVIPELRSGRFELQTSSITQSQIMHNGYFDGTDFRYRASSGYFGAIQLLSGGFQFVGTATAGTAGAAVTYTIPFTLSYAGAAVFAGAVSGSNLSGTNTGNVTYSGQTYLSLSGQALTGAAVDLSGTHVTGTLAAARFPALTGDVTNTAGALATTIANNAVTTAKINDAAVTLAKMANVATGTVFYRKTASTGVPEVQTLATLKTDIGLLAAYLSSDQSKINSTFANVDDLVVTLVSGKIYQIIFSGNADILGGGGAKVDFNGGTATTTGTINGGWTAINYNNNTVSGGKIAALTQGPIAAANNPNADISTLWAIFTVHVSSGGTLKVRFAQSTTDASASNLLANATLRAIELA